MKLKILFLSFIMLFFQNHFFAQTSSYFFSEEDLNKGATGPGLQLNMENTPWSLDVSQANFVDEEAYCKIVDTSAIHGDYSLVAQNTKGIVTFTSPWFVRECVDLYEFSIFVYTSSGLERVRDFAQLSYELPNGSIVPFEENDFISGNGREFFPDDISTINAKSGDIDADSARVIVEMRNDEVGEYYGFSGISLAPRGNTFYYFTEAEKLLEGPFSSDISHEFKVFKNNASFAAVVSVVDITPEGAGFATAGEDYEFTPQAFQYNFELGPFAGAQTGRILIKRDEIADEGDEKIILEMTAVEEGAVEYCARQMTIILREQAALPIELTSFEAIPEKQNAVRLNWQLANLHPLSQFVVEHSFDGANFDEIGFVDVEENVDQYHFLHTKARSGTNYYRLQQLENDGRKSYSKILTADLQVSEMQLFPVPATDFINLTLPNKLQSPLPFEVYNAFGQLQFRGQLSGNNLNQTITLPNHLNAGIYYLQTEKLGVKRFVIQ